MKVLFQPPPVLLHPLSVQIRWPRAKPATWFLALTPPRSFTFRRRCCCCCRPFHRPIHPYRRSCFYQCCCCWCYCQCIHRSCCHPSWCFPSASSPRSSPQYVVRPPSSGQKSKLPSSCPLSIAAIVICLFAPNTTVLDKTKSCSGSRSTSDSSSITGGGGMICDVPGCC